MTRIRFPLLVALACAAVAPEALTAQEYQLPEYDDGQRWNRASTLLTAVLVGDLAKSMATGMGAAESGAESGRLFGPPNGWNGADTPFSLFRGMYRNMMADPNQTCELLEASDTEVRARCNRPYTAYFGESGETMGVTVEHYDASFEAFASTIADYHGMDWEQAVQGDEIMYTIRKR